MENRTLSSKALKLLVDYGATILFVAAALALNLLMWTRIKSIASPLFFLAIFAAAWRFGTKPGMVATVLSGVIIDYFFVSPENKVGGSVDSFLRLSIFFIEGAGLVYLINWIRTIAEEAKESRENLRALSTRQQSLLEQERRRMAREIHDELGQALTGLKLDLHMIRNEIKEGKPVSEQVAQRMKDLPSQIDSSITTVRRIATELRPPILDDLGLVAAIEWQTQEFQRRTGKTCLMSANVDGVDMSADGNTAIFRIFQEALTNIARHADAETVTVDLRERDRKVVLRIEDDGKGIDESRLERTGSLGIMGMRERARLINAELEVFRGTPNGTVVLLTAPVN